jgi:hypothetical protein
MALKFSNSQEFLNKLQLAINMFIAVPMLGFIVLFLRIENKTYNPDFLGEEFVFNLRWIEFFLVTGLAALGLIVFHRIRKRLTSSMTIREKLMIYYQASISRSYYFLAATLLALAGLALTAESFHVIYYTISLVMFSITYPTIFRINRELRLNKEEREVIISRGNIK